MQVSVHEAESRFPELLARIEEGETVVIARNGKPVAELIPAREKTGFPFGIASAAPLVPAGNEWWKPMTDAEAEDWIEGR